MIRLAWDVFIEREYLCSLGATIPWKLDNPDDVWSPFLSINKDFEATNSKISYTCYILRVDEDSEMWK